MEQHRASEPDPHALGKEEDPEGIEAEHDRVSGRSQRLERTVDRVLDVTSLVGCRKSSSSVAMQQVRGGACAPRGNDEVLDCGAYQW